MGNSQQVQGHQASAPVARRPTATPDSHQRRMAAARRFMGSRRTPCDGAAVARAYCRAQHQRGSAAHVRRRGVSHFIKVSS